METLENENEKVNRISEHLRKEVLEPAEIEAVEIIENAKKQADEIIRLAEKRAEELKHQAQALIAQEKKVFQSSLDQGAKQSLESLRQAIKKNLFNPHLESLILNKASQPDIIAKIIEALIQGIKKWGITGELKAYIPSNLQPEEVNHLLLNEVVQELESHSVSIGNFKGGAQVKLVNKNMILDMSESALKELISEFIREDLRKYIFSA